MTQYTCTCNDHTHEYKLLIKNLIENLGTFIVNIIYLRTYGCYLEKILWFINAGFYSIALDINSFIFVSCLINSVLCCKENLEVEIKGIASLTGGGFQEDPVTKQAVMKSFEILQENIINDISSQRRKYIS